jgi:hypothetical protein
VNRWAKRLEVAFGLCVLAGLATGATPGLSHRVHSSGNAVQTDLLVLGSAGLLGLRSPRWWQTLRGRSAPQGLRTRIIAGLGLCALAGVLSGACAGLFRAPVRLVLNTAAVILVAVSVAGWLIVEGLRLWRERQEPAE